MSEIALPSSFRDPSGFLFHSNGVLYRQVNRFYQEHYDKLISSGLYDKLVKADLLVPHEETDHDLAESVEAYKIIKPEPVPFISYPYEWCFSQLKDAALVTLEIAQTALESGMLLKDASAYNIQFLKGKPLLIDTLSFEVYREGEPWIAYRQFCQHFLAPLTLMVYTDIRLNQLLRVFIDGVPLDLTSKLLPGRTRVKPSILAHIHIHAKSQQKYAAQTTRITSKRMSKRALQGLLDNLYGAVRKLTIKFPKTEWANYYDETNYSNEGLEKKGHLVGQFLQKIKPEVVWDLGANTGQFSRIAAEQGINVISFDIDPVAVERNYREGRKKKESHVLPLLLDLTNPSGAIGWANRERMSLSERSPADTVLALALIHHLAISNNLPLSLIANWFSEICDTLIVEFVPKSDSQVQRLLATREDIFPHYTQPDFEKDFAQFFTITDKAQVAESERTIYSMRRRTE